MGWVKKVPQPHDCKKPTLTAQYGHGSIWECDGCHQRWYLLRNEIGHRYWKKAPEPLKVDPVEYDYPEKKSRRPWWFSHA